MTFDLNKLPLLSKQKDFLFVDEIPYAFRNDIINFIIGRTLSGCENGRIRVGSNLYKKWIKKIWEKGFDYDIDLKTVE